MENFFDKEVCGSPLSKHMKVAYGDEVARRCAAEGWTTYGLNQIPRTFKMVLEILTSHPWFTCFPQKGERLLSAIVKWIYVLTIETVQDQERVYGAVK